jgi:hypothetical protein
VAVQSKAWVYGRPLARIVGSNPAGAWIYVYCKYYVLLGSCFWDGPITRPKEFYRMWCVWVWTRNLDIEEPLPTRAVEVWQKYSRKFLCNSESVRNDQVGLLGTVVTTFLRMATCISGYVTMSDCDKAILHSFHMRSFNLVTYQPTPRSSFDVTNMLLRIHAETSSDLNSVTFIALSSLTHTIAATLFCEQKFLISLSMFI